MPNEPLRSDASTASIQVHMLGAWTLTTADGHVHNLPRRIEGELFAFLLLTHGRTYSREEITDRVWPDTPANKAGQKFRKSLHQLRAELRSIGLDPDAVLDTDRTSLRLHPGSFWIDFKEFQERCSTNGTNGDIVALRDRLHRAIELYRGGLLPGFYGELFEAEQTRAEQSYLDALLRFSESWEQLGEFDHAIEAAHKVVEVDDLREEAYIRLMRLYAATGQPTRVESVFNEYERVLKAMAAKPSTELRELMERLRDEARGRVANEVVPEKTKPSKPLQEKTTVETPSTFAPPRVEPSRLLPLPTYRVIGALAFLGLALFLAFIVKNRANDATPLKPTPSSSSPAQTPATPFPTITDRVAKVLTPEWTREFKELQKGESGPAPVALATDDSGNVFMTGFLRVEVPAEDNSNVFLAKYDSNGNLHWQKRFDGEAEDYDHPTHILTDKERNVYVIVRSAENKDYQHDGLSYVDVIVLKYSPEGKLLWKVRKDGDDGGEEHPIGAVLDEAGGIVIAWNTMIRSKGVAGSHKETRVLRLETGNGKQKWFLRLNKVQSGNPTANSLSVHPGEAVYLAGTGMKSVNGAMQRQAFATRLNLQNGKEEWFKYTERANVDEEDIKVPSVVHQDGGLVIAFPGAVNGKPDDHWRAVQWWVFSKDGQDQRLDPLPRRDGNHHTPIAIAMRGDKVAILSEERTSNDRRIRLDTMEAPKMGIAVNTQYYEPGQLTDHDRALSLAFLSDTLIVVCGEVFGFTQVAPFEADRDGLLLWFDFAGKNAKGFAKIDLGHSDDNEGSMATGPNGEVYYSVQHRHGNRNEPVKLYKSTSP